MPFNMGTLNSGLASLATSPLFDFGVGMLSQPPSRVPVSFGQSLARGLGYMGAVQQAQQQAQYRRLQAQALKQKLADAQQQSNAASAQQAAQSAYGATLPQDQQALYAADPSGYIGAQLKSDAANPWTLPKGATGEVNLRTGQVRPLSLVNIPANVPMVGQSSSFLTRLPAETQAYVPKYLQTLSGEPAFKDGQLTDAGLAALHTVEDPSGNPVAVSPAGAVGTTQMLPATAASVGVTNPANPAQDDAGARRYMAELYQRFGGNVPEVIAAYNAGPGAVARAVSAPNLPMTPQQRVAQALYGNATARGHMATPAEVAQMPGVPAGSSVWIAPNGEPKIIARGNGFQGGVAPMPGNPDLSGQAYLESVDPQVRTLAEGLLSGTKPWPTGTVLKNPLWSQAVIAAQHAEPGFNADTYNQRAKARNAFTNGKQGDMFRQLRTIAMHANQYIGDVNALDNSNITPWNAVRNAAESAMGAKAPGNVATDAHALSEETAKFLTGGVPGEATMKEWEDSLGANASRGQQISRVTRLIGIVGGQLASLVQQYKTAMGPVSEPLGVINPEAAEAFKNLVATAKQAGVTLPPHIADLQSELDVPTPGASAQSGVANPAAPQSVGPTAINPKTGERLQLRDGKWVPLR